MFVYCTEVLHLSEAEAYLRIAAARAAREHPIFLEMLADGRLHLTGIAKLAPHLTQENREALLKRAAHKSKREIEELVAELAPRPDARAVMRKLPAHRAENTPALSGSIGRGGLAPAVELHPDEVTPLLELRPDGVAAPRMAGRTRPATVEALAPARYKVQFAASAVLHGKLERLRALMRCSVPDGDLAVVIEQAVTEKLERLEARRFARTRMPRRVLPAHNTSPSGRGPSPVAGKSPPSARSSSPATRHIPAAVKRAVYQRDGGSSPSP